MFKPVAMLMLLSIGGAFTATQASSPTESTLEPGAASTSPDEALEEIVVTSQKVSESLQKSAIAVSAISAEALDDANVVSPKDMNAMVPGLIANSTPSNPLAISIRGAGYQGIENNSAQPGVGFNQNGVYVSSPVALNSNFLDVEQIEVTRGPQGTVLGQNSDGGSINVTTVQPEIGLLSGSGELSAANYDYDRVRVAANVPVGDDIAVRVAFQQEKHDGYTTAESPDASSYQLGNENSYNGGVNALWKPSERLSVDVWGEFYTNSANGEAFKNIYDPNPNPYVATQDFPGLVDAQSALTPQRWFITSTGPSRRCRFHVLSQKRSAPGPGSKRLARQGSCAAEWRKIPRQINCSGGAGFGYLGILLWAAARHQRAAARIQAKYLDRLLQRLGLLHECNGSGA